MKLQSPLLSSASAPGEGREGPQRHPGPRSRLGSLRSCPEPGPASRSFIPALVPARPRAPPQTALGSRAQAWRSPSAPLPPAPRLTRSCSHGCRRRTVTTAPGDALTFSSKRNGSHRLKCKASQESLRVTARRLHGAGGNIQMHEIEPDAPDAVRTSSQRVWTHLSRKKIYKWPSRNHLLFQIENCAMMRKSSYIFQYVRGPLNLNPHVQLSE
ncbi:uncharacterized protein LOC134365577 [Cynocephalus volans]|uniref:uncharacterized protein LOC134365577 n=1 Tax=Cynocephalus volans TaxID=110931 RepID=UPI002FC7BAF3